MCVVGAKDMDEATRMQNNFSILVCKHQAINGMHASVENPKGSLLWKLPEWVEAFGSPGKIIPEHPIWNWVTSDGCQFHVVYPGDDDYGAPMEKSQL